MIYAVPLVQSSDGASMVQDEQHVSFDCQHFQHLRLAKPGLLQLTREASLWKVVNEYNVSFAYIAWFLQETASSCMR